MGVNADAEVVLGQRTGAFAKSERGSSTVFSPARRLRVGVGRERNLDEIDDPVNATSELVKIDVLVSSHQQVSDTLEELEMFASVLGGNLGVGSTDEGDRVAADFLDIRLQNGVGSYFQEGHVLSPEFLNNLVESGPKEHGLTNVVPAVLDVQITLEPFTVDGGHDLSNRLAGGGESPSDEVLEEVLLSLHERGVERTGDTKLGGEDLVGRVSSNFNHEVDEFVLAGDGNSLGRVDAGDPEATVDSGTGEDPLDHQFRLLDTDTQCHHSTITLSLRHGSSATDGNTYSSLAIVVAGSIAHGDLTNRVTNDVIVLDPETLEKVGKGDLDEDEGNDDISDRPNAVGGEGGLLSRDEKTGALDERRLTILFDQNLVVCLDGTEEGGESFRKLATHVNVLGTLSGEDQAQLGLRRNESDLRPFEVGGKCGTDSEGTVWRSTGLTSELTGERTKGPRFIQVLEVRSESVLQASERALGESTDGEQVERSGIGLGLTNESGGNFDFRGGLKGFEDDVSIGATNTVSRDRCNELAIGSSQLGSDLLEFSLNPHHSTNEINLGVGLIEADIGDDFLVVKHQGDLD